MTLEQIRKRTHRWLEVVYEFEKAGMHTGGWSETNNKTSIFTNDGKFVGWLDKNGNFEMEREEVLKNLKTMQSKNAE